MIALAKPFLIRFKSVVTGMLVLTLVTCFSNKTSAQPLSKKTKQEIQTICNQYVTLKNVFLSDSLDKEVQSIVSDSLFEFFLLQRTYFNLMEYRIGRSDSSQIIAHKVNKVGSFAQCEMFHTDTLLYTIELSPNDTGYIIVGFNNEYFDIKYAKFYVRQIDSLVKQNSIKDTIKATVRNFIEGLNSYYGNHDTTALKASTTPLNFNTLVLRYACDTLRGFRRSKTMTIREMDKPVLLNDSVATCHISTNSGNTTMDLRRKSNKWIVVGENGHAPDTKSYDELVLRLNKQLAIKFLSNDMDSFNKAALAYLKHGTYNDFALKTSYQVADVLELIKNHLGVFNKKHIKLYGFYIESHGNNVEFSEDLMKAKVTVKQTTLTVEKKDIWRVTSIDSTKPFNNPAWMMDHFRDYTNAFKIFQYPFDEGVETDIVEMISVGDVDTSILGVLAQFKSTPRSLVTYEALFTQIDALTKSYTKNGTLTGQVYVQFVIEYGGSVNHVQISSSTNTALNLAALEILGKLPKWYPGFTLRGPVRSKFVLPIGF
ncbi:MAG: hypothetical protein ACI9JN_002141 [Bacteroidia bacterium]|jgi:hypothetical protein